MAVVAQGREVRSYHVYNDVGLYLTTVIVEVETDCAGEDIWEAIYAKCPDLRDPAENFSRAR